MDAASQFLGVHSAFFAVLTTARLSHDHPFNRALPVRFAWSSELAEHGVTKKKKKFCRFVAPRPQKKGRRLGSMALVESTVSCAPPALDNNGIIRHNSTRPSIWRSTPRAGNGCEKERSYYRHQTSDDNMCMHYIYVYMCQLHGVSFLSSYKCTICTKRYVRQNRTRRAQIKTARAKNA